MRRTVLAFGGVGTNASMTLLPGAGFGGVRRGVFCSGLLEGFWTCATWKRINPSRPRRMGKIPITGQHGCCCAFVTTGLKHLWQIKVSRSVNNYRRLLAELIRIELALGQGVHVRFLHANDERGFGGAAALQFI